ncbi:MAG TPA: oligosaccharide flippase family protein [Candidatus Dormibacteraeota bacterium]|nr:oligosaccharide flippase family protein [Candidatus Dormibacteraeota bacterium]
MTSRTLIRRLYRDDFVRHGALVFAGTMAGNVGGYVYHFALSRQLGPVGYGELLSLISLLMIAGVPASVVATVVARYAAEFHALGDRDHLRGLVEWIVRVGVVGGLVVLAVGTGLLGAIARYLHLPTATPVLLALIAGALSFFGPVMRSVLQGCHRFSGFSASSAVEGVGKALFGVLAVAVGFGVAGAVGGFAAGSLAGLLLTLALVRSELGERAPFRIDLRRFVETTVGVGGSSLATTALMTVDVVMARHYLPPHEMGYYAAASLVGRSILFALGFVPGVMIPKASALHAKGESASGVLLRGLLLAGAASLAALIVLAADPSLAVRIVAGGQFLPAAHYVLAYGVAMMFLTGTATLVSYRTSLHRFGYVLPLLAVAAAEVAALAAWHADVRAFLAVVVAANAVGFGISLFGANPPNTIVLFAKEA